MVIKEYPTVTSKLTGKSKAVQKRYLIVTKILEESAVCQVNRFKDHQLKGSLKDFRELHLDGDFLLLYKEINGEVHLVNILSHKEMKNFKGAEEEKDYILELGYNYITL
jgi:mRNA interferase YafQ